MASDAVPQRVQARFPDWHFWSGVTGLLYARRPKTSPPKVVRAEHPDGLAEAITEAEHPLYWERARALAAGELEHHISSQQRFGGPVPAGL